MKGGNCIMQHKSSMTYVKKKSIKHKEFVKTKGVAWE
jgi:hypothetical protein